MTKQKWNDSADENAETPEGAKNQPQPDKPSQEPGYHPSVTRIYVGPMLWAVGVNGAFATDVGATIAASGHVDDNRIFFVGLRLGIVGDPSGVLTMFDFDFGFRPRVVENKDVGVSIVIGGGLGAGFFFLANAPTVAAFHLPLRVGPCFDLGAFTFELLGGPSLFAAKAAVGAFESMLDVGVRF